MKKKRRIDWFNVSILVLITILLITILRLVFYSSEVTTNSFSVEDSKPLIIEEVIINVEPEEEKNIPGAPVYLGRFKLTGYCPCEKCCGKWSDGITATGTIAKEGRTIAVDKNLIPLGSTVIINDNIYIAEDVGGSIKGNRIDIYRQNHSDCYDEMCNQYADVYILK